MRALLQRVRHARVEVDGDITGAIDSGLLVFLGVGRDDTEDDLHWLVRRILGLRIFEDDTGRMQHDVRDVGGALLVVSQFTLYGDCRRGRRPSFTEAMAPESAARMVDRFVDALRDGGVPVETGRFGAMMDVHLLNDGPVTLMLESPPRTP
ncbi:MAG: D-tyrosyl-tRNA(Tyr) deacylase [Deltaproteobacteria bacterium]|nr:MAG: D-tyrosyl-tRNA(Tyr) deacylase [Deltaproteobacteria bacterium]